TRKLMSILLFFVF
ncbi:hypothetical protein D046_0842B, partial [Vibrio parahaemolyticus V-223/04]